MIRSFHLEKFLVNYFLENLRKIEMVNRNLIVFGITGTESATRGYYGIERGQNDFRNDC